jgi:MFS family permease
MMPTDVRKLTESPPPPAFEQPFSLARFHHLAFTVLWATVISNIGTWMQSAAASWLMTDLNPHPLIVSLVQVMANLPMFLFAIPAGALADIFDRRRLMIVIQIAITVLGFGFAFLVRLGGAMPDVLLGFVFLAATTAALMMPVWQSIVRNWFRGPYCSPPWH